eukprot:GFYU01002594.1.p1 GENE.GFYU01002594.1~~GFYU01002594.1.p1  ORF type:complete len:239 (-),score=73.64 GFYU01002594.1:417-1091(-)
MTDQQVEEFKGWLTSGMQSQLGIADDAYVDYVCGMLEEIDINEERVEGLTDFFAELTETDVVPFCEEAVGKWESLTSAKEAEAEKAKAEMEAQRKEELEAQRQADLAAIAAAKESQTSKELTKEQKKERYALINKYGIDMEDSKIVLDEDGKNAAKKGKSKATDDGEFVNNNAALVAEKERHYRETQKANHEKEKQKIKEQQEREKAAKEKEKRRTQKKEKKRF